MAMSGIKDVNPAVNIITETLLKSSYSWDGAAYLAYPQGRPELNVLKISIPRQTVLNWHYHPVPNVGYVVSGSITVEKLLDGSRKTVYAGETLPETVGTLHRGFTADEPATLLVFYAGAEGVPLSETPA